MKDSEEDREPDPVGSGFLCEREKILPFLQELQSKNGFLTGVNTV